jgi:phytoene dehydrogenase-like protein
MLPTAADVVVVGAGLAGLAATIHLARAGVDVLLLEASDDVGGRVRTDIVDGFRIDRGFQVIASSYPELRSLVDLGEIDLRPFVPGVGVYGGGVVHRLLDPRHDPSAVRSALTAPIGSWADRVRLARYALELLSTPGDDLADAEDRPASEAFVAAGLSARAIDRLLRPFLRGVVLEEDLVTSRRFVDLAVRSMLRGPVAIPAGGMQQLPRALGRLVPPDRLTLECSVTKLTPRTVQTSLGSVKTSNVVIATDPAAAHTLLDDFTSPVMRSVTTFFHATDAAPWPEPLLLVDGEQNLVANSVVLSQAAAEYAPPGAALIATSVLGTRDDVDTERRVRQRVASLYGCSTAGWELVATRAIGHALPAMPAPHDFRRPVRLAPGRYVAGDHRDSGSIQGALVSGRRAAEAVLADLMA